LPKPGAFQDPMHAGWIGPGERAWLLRPGRRDRRQQVTYCFEWGVRPQLLACRAEHCQRQSPAWLHRAPHVRKGGRWIAKKHDSKARERQLEAVRRKGWTEASATMTSACRRPAAAIRSGARATDGS